MTQADDFPPTQWLGVRPETAGDPAGARPLRAAMTQSLSVRFTGSGSEYFRIWIVNLLLILVTFTLYLPFARARRMAYFQNNTLVGGDPLGFHADPWKMFRGYLLVLAFGIAYWAVSNFLPTLAWVAFLMLMALWPLLWRASLQFRLRNTSWRGVRLDFLGDTKSAYLAMLPFFLPGLVFVGAAPWLEVEGELADDMGATAAALFGGVVLVFLVLLPWFWTRLKRYQHGGYAFAQERTELDVGAGSFYGLFFKTLGVSLLLTLALGTLVAIVAAVAALSMGMEWSSFSDDESAYGVLIGGFVAVLGLLAYVLAPLVVGSYLNARMQNLLWSNTRSPQIRFESDLRLIPLFKLTLVNWLLIALTLGLYWPFAKIRAARIRLEAIALEVDGPMDDWMAEAQRRSKGTVGDAAGDFFGIDMGL